MRLEIEFFRDQLHPGSGIRWESPIAHIIPRTPTFTSFGDSCLEGAGGYSLSLGFWWHLSFLDEIKDRTLLKKRDNSDGQLISINVLEFVTVIINYCAALHLVIRSGIMPHTTIVCTFSHHLSALRNFFMCYIKIVFFFCNTISLFISCCRYRS